MKGVNRSAVPVSPVSVEHPLTYLGMVCNVHGAVLEALDGDGEVSSIVMRGHEVVHLS